VRVLGWQRMSLFAAVVAAGPLVWGCARSSSDASYAGKLLAERAAKNAAFGTSEDSPIPPDRRAEFLPLSYFPPDETYVAPASLAPIEPERALTIEMPTSTGARRLMRRVGTLGFMLKGQPLKLTAFMEANARGTEPLFVPFTDLTTGTETYSAGRYIELEPTPTGIYTVDFNRAFNPFCYYNPTYDCPFPPVENRLQLPIRAGERVAARAK
jgi:uncharacterized protein (DUF1684 family)